MKSTGMCQWASKLQYNKQFEESCKNFVKNCAIQATGSGH